MPDDGPFADLPEWCAEDLRAAVAETLRKREEKRALRERLAAARAYGLKRRHAAKLARNRERGSDEQGMGEGERYTLAQVPADHPGQG